MSENKFYNARTFNANIAEAIEIAYIEKAIIEAGNIRNFTPDLSDSQKERLGKYIDELLSDILSKTRHFLDRHAVHDPAKIIEERAHLFLIKNREIIERIKQI